MIRTLELVVVLVLVSLAGCTAPPAASGIEGTVTVGPTCPVQQDPPRDGCDDKPLAVTLQALEGTRVVASFASDDTGRYNVTLAPGTYTIRDRDQSLPSCQAGPVTVLAGAYATLDIACDSGIR